MTRLSNHKRIWLCGLLCLWFCQLVAAEQGFLHFFAAEHPQLLLLPREWTGRQISLEQPASISPYSAVCGNQCLAIGIPPNTGGTLLCNEKSSPSASLPTTATFPPVRVTRQAHIATSRAFTPEEILRHFAYVAASKSNTQRACVAQIGERPAGDNWRHSSQLGEKKRPNLVDFWRWEAVFCLDDDSQLAFGSDQGFTCWTIWIDGQPVADWRTALPGPENRFFGQASKLAAGLHSLQFLVIQKSDESLPACLFRPADSQDAGQPIANLLPCQPATKFEAGIADKPLLSCTMQLDLTKSLVSRNGASWTVYQCTQQGQNTDKTNLVTNQGCWPALDCQLGDGLSLHFPALPRLAIGVKAEELRWRWENLPLGLSPGQPLAWHASLLNASCLSQESATLRQEALSKDGQVLMETPLDWSTDGRFGTSMTLPKDAAWLRLSLTISDVEPVDDLRLRLMPPQDDLSHLSCSANYLLQDDGTRVVLCPSADKFPVPGKNVWKAPRLVMLSENAWYPAELRGDFAGSLAAVWPEAQVQAVPVPPSAGSDLICRELLAALKMLDQEEQLVMLNLGDAARYAGLSADDWLPCLKFCAQAVLHRGKLPILVTFPEADDHWRSASRDYALAVKRLGAELQVPVLDLYSFQNKLPKSSQPNVVEWQADRLNQAWAAEIARHLERLRQDALNGQRKHFDN